MDAFELLKADHKKVAELFDQLESASGNAKLDVFNKIKSELDLHAHVEEAIFYPVLERPQKTHDLTLEAYEEHKVVKRLLTELSAATTATEEWEAKAKVLRENVEHHVDEEENELFDKAGEVLTDVEIEALGNRMEAEKVRKQGHPAPEQTTESDKSPEASDNKPGILAKIADFVGLGSDTSSKTARKKPAKKTAPKKASKAPAKRATKKTAPRKASKAAAKTATKKTAARKGSKAAARKTAKKTVARRSSKVAAKTPGRKKAGKTSTAATRKRSTTARGSKKAASRSGGSKKASGAVARKKSAKKRAGRKR